MSLLTMLIINYVIARRGGGAGGGGGYCTCTLYTYLESLFEALYHPLKEEMTTSAANSLSLLIYCCRMKL